METTGFVREKGLKTKRTEFKDKFGSFDDYTADKVVEVMQGRSPKKGTPLVTGRLADGKLVLYTHTQLNECQDRYPEIPFLVNADGKIAQPGENYHINPQVVSSRDGGELVLS